MKTNTPFVLIAVLLFSSGYLFYAYSEAFLLTDRNEVVIIQALQDQDINNRVEVMDWVEVMHHLNKDIQFVTIVDRSQKKALDFLEENDIPFETVPELLSTTLLDMALKYPKSLLISPRLLCEIANITPSAALLKQAIQGYKMDSNQQYILSYFDNRGCFRVSPSYILSLDAEFSQRLLFLKQQDYAHRYQDYMSLLQERSQEPSLQALQANRLKRLQWLSTHCDLSVYEAGFFSQIEGEQLWQSLVWNHNARYLMPPKQWPALKALHTPYQTIIPFKEIQWISPEYAQAITNVLLLYNDCLFFKTTHSDLAFQLRQEAQNALSRIPFAESQTLLQVYGNTLFDDLFEK